MRFVFLNSYFLPVFILIFVFIAFENIITVKKIKHLSFIKNRYLQRVVRALRYRSIVSAVLLSFSFFFIAISLLKPSIFLKKSFFIRKSTKVYFAFEFSQSMNAEDIIPSRLEVSKEIAKKIVESVSIKSKFSIITFSDSLNIVSPLTEDYNFIKNRLLDLRLERSKILYADLKTLLSYFNDLSCKKARGTALILFTDGYFLKGVRGENFSNFKECGGSIVVFVVGKDEGSFVPQRDKDGEFVGWLKDEKGENIRVKLNVASVLSVFRESENIFFIKDSEDFGKDELLRVNRKILLSSRFSKHNLSQYALLLGFLFFVGFLFFRYYF